MPIEDNSTPQQTLVDVGTTLKGAISSTCPVLVKGTIEGDLEVPDLTVSAGGSVQGAVVAKRVYSQGTVAGSLKADEVVLSGAVLANTVIEAGRLEIALDGKGKALQLTFGEGESPDRSVSVSPTSQTPSQKPPASKKSGAKSARAGGANPA